MVLSPVHGSHQTPREKELKLVQYHRQHDISVCNQRDLHMDMFFMCSTKQGGTSCVDKWKWMCSHGSQFLDCGDMYSVCVFDGIQFLVCEYTYSVFGLLAFHY